MSKSEFLNQLKTITRKDIDRILEEKCKRVKKINPIIIIRPPKNKNNKNGG